MRRFVILGLAILLLLLLLVVGGGLSSAGEPSPSRSSSGGGFFNRLFSSSSPATPQPPQPDLYDKLLFYPTKHPQGFWDAPTPDREDVAGHHFPNLAWAVPAGKLNSVGTLATYDGPLFQSHGDADRTIPFEEGNRLHEAARGPKEFLRIEHGGHNDPQPTEYYRRLDRFIEGLPKLAHVE